jgi:hypothetical protein
MEVAMSKTEMKLKMKLEKIVETKTTKDTKYSMVFTPTLDDLKNEIQLKLSCKDPYDLAGRLGLPSSLDDTVIVSFSQREEQTTLTGKKGKDK